MVEVEFMAVCGGVVPAVVLAAAEVKLTVVIPDDAGVVALVVITGTGGVVPAVWLAAAEVELTVPDDAGVVAFVVSTTVTLPPAFTVRSSVADASRFKNMSACAMPPKALRPKSS